MFSVVTDSSVQFPGMNSPRHVRHQNKVDVHMAHMAWYCTVLYCVVLCCGVVRRPDQVASPRPLVQRSPSPPEHSDVRSRWRRRGHNWAIDCGLPPGCVAFQRIHVPAINCTSDPTHRGLGKLFVGEVVPVPSSLCFLN